MSTMFHNVIHLVLFLANLTVALVFSVTMVFKYNMNITLEPLVLCLSVLHCMYFSVGAYSALSEWFAPKETL